MYTKTIKLYILIIFNTVQWSDSCCTRKRWDENKVEPLLTDSLIAITFNLTNIQTGRTPKQQSNVGNSVSYDIGDILRAKCRQLRGDPKKYYLQWYQTSEKLESRHEYLGAIPQCLVNECVLELKLELFDIRTRITCAIFQNGVREPIKSESINLHLRDSTIDIHQRTSSELALPITNTFNFECDIHPVNTTIGIHSPTSLQSFIGANKILNNSTIASGKRVFCLHYTSTLTDNTHIMKRDLNTYTLFTDNIGEAGGSEAGSYSTTLIGIIVGGVAVICVGAALITILIMKCKNQSTPAQKVTYADLEMLQARSIQFSGRNDPPYAKVIGVLAPKTT